MTGLVVVLGAGVGLGLVLIVSGWTSAARPPWPAQRRLGWMAGGGGVVLGALVMAVSGWPAVGVGVSLAAASAPAAWRRFSRGRLYSTERLEAIATWIEMLRDRLSAGGWFQTTVVETADLAPERIRPELRRFALALSDPAPGAVDVALAQLAADLDDTSGDLLVVALAMWARGNGTNLRELLSTLARQARAEAADQREVDASRAMLRRERLIITIVLGAIPVTMTLVDPGYLAPFGTRTGQVVLAVVVALYGAGLVMLSRLGRPQRPPRVIDTAEVFHR